MAKDPIVEEIHQIREELLKEHGGMDGYMQHLHCSSRASEAGSCGPEGFLNKSRSTLAH